MGIAGFPITVEKLLFSRTMRAIWSNLGTEPFCETDVDGAEAVGVEVAGAGPEGATVEEDLVTGIEVAAAWVLAG